jgi:hypothetical protein
MRDAMAPRLGVYPRGRYAEEGGDLLSREEVAA